MQTYIYARIQRHYVTHFQPYHKFCPYEHLDILKYSTKCVVINVHAYIKISVALKSCGILFNRKTREQTTWDVNRTDARLYRWHSRCLSKFL